MEYSFEVMSKDHAEEVMDIFNYYIENSFAAYPSAKLPYQFFGMFLEMTKGFPAFVIRNDGNGKAAGFCFLKPYNPIPAFRETAEITYFLHKDETGKGIGGLALDRLEKEALNKGIMHILASISSKNQQSLNFHSKKGFVECGRLSGIGQKHGEYFDVVYMQKLIG